MEVLSLIAHNNRKQAETEYWYAMRVTYRRELKMQMILQQESKETFVPMITRFVKKGRAIQRIIEPALHNLLFVKASEVFLQEFKQRHPELQYIISYDNGKKIKTIVPDRQMQDFMTVCRLQDDTLEFSTSSDLHLQPGDKVRIIDGPLKGLEGTFQRVQGHRSRRFIIAIEGVVAVTTATIQTNQIEKLSS